MKTICPLKCRGGQAVPPYSPPPRSPRPFKITFSPFLWGGSGLTRPTGAFKETPPQEETLWIADPFKKIMQSTVHHGNTLC